MINLNTIINYVIQNGLPDLHLQVDQKPMVRMQNGELHVLDNESILTQEDLNGVVGEITNEEQREAFEKNEEVDFSYQAEGGRFRVNIYKERTGPAIAFRMIPENIPSLDELGIKEIGDYLAGLPHGLVLITGPTGSGKSTTLASIIETINQTRSTHIITVEDPIEYVYAPKKALVTQRELGAHTKSFEKAIRASLRQDPDVVMVGEMRDLETISAAITLAETGHLVFSTLHTTDAAQTVDRIIDVFPPYQQQQIRMQLASTLKGVISQILIPTKDESGRVAAREVMLGNDAIKNCIMKAETHQIYSIIQINGENGMKLMDQSLLELYRAEMITVEQALGKATDPESLQNQLMINA